MCVGLCAQELADLKEEDLPSSEPDNDDTNTASTSTLSELMTQLVKQMCIS